MLQYILLFFEGVITFISPCMLPMLPVYIVYFAGGKESNSPYTPLKNAIGFVLGFTLVFVVLGAFAGTIGRVLREYNTALNILSGIIVVLLGLSFLEIIKLPSIKGDEKFTKNIGNLKFFSSILFGVIFSISWTPCVGAFLGAALMQAGQQGGMLKGIIMLLFYSLGLGLPFVISAVLINKLKSLFDMVKQNYKIINAVAGVFLILTGILMMTGKWGYLLYILS